MAVLLLRLGLLLQLGVRVTALQIHPRSSRPAAGLDRRRVFRDGVAALLLPAIVKTPAEAAEEYDPLAMFDSSGRMIKGMDGGEPPKEVRARSPGLGQQRIVT